jgi:hypothetical protein
MLSASNNARGRQMIQRRAAKLGPRVKIGCRTFPTTGITAHPGPGRRSKTPRPWQRMRVHGGPNSMTESVIRALDEVERIKIWYTFRRRGGLRPDR